MSTAWSPEQRRCLAALGYTLYEPAVPAMTNADGPSLNTIDDPLLLAVMRAAGRAPEGETDACAWLLAQHIPPLAQLRADPSAKRAAWPRLRAMRSGRPDA